MSLKQFLCRWLHGHQMKAEFIMRGDTPSWRFWCTRCNATLPGPDK
jgi:hypothetical protein